MTNIFPGMFEDRYLKIFSESIQQLAIATSVREIDQAVQKGFSAMENVANIATRERAKQRLRTLEEFARKRIGQAG